MAPHNWYGSFPPCLCLLNTNDVYTHVGTHWSSEICEKAVQQCYVNLTKYMEPSLIVPLLVQSKHLRLEQVNEIFSLQTKREQALMLLSLLPRSGRYAYQGLFKALKDETELKAHEELLEQLERTCECKWVEGSYVALVSATIFVEFCSCNDPCQEYTCPCTISLM